MSSFTFPNHYNWPPFFTLQPKTNVYNDQIELWINLILKYCRFHKLSNLTVNNSQKDFFRNEKIERELSAEEIRKVFEEMVQRGKAQWIGTDQIKIYYHSAVEWAEIIWKWVQENGYQNTVCTIFELIEGETGEGAPFYGLEDSLFREGLEVLEKKGKCKIMETGVDLGVKFLM